MSNNYPPCFRIDFVVILPSIELPWLNAFLQDPATKFHEAVTRLYMKIGYKVHDFFAGDIFYHNSCLLNLHWKKLSKQ